MQKSIIIETTPDELINLLVFKLEDLLKTQNKKTEVVHDEFLDIHGASVFLKLSVSTLRKKAQKCTIPCFKRGGRWLFSKAELIDYIHQGKQITFS